MRVAIKGHQEAYGASSIASGKEVAARADNLLSFDQMVSIMHRSYAADLAIHSDPLRCLQTGVEVRITHQAGCRGQIVRSACWEHIWLHDYDMLADGDGINGVTLYNNRAGTLSPVGCGGRVRCRKRRGSDLGPLAVCAGRAGPRTLVHSLCE